MFKLVNNVFNLILYFYMVTLTLLFLVYKQLEMSLVFSSDTILEAFPDIKEGIPG